MGTALARGPESINPSSPQEVAQQHRRSASVVAPCLPVCRYIAYNLTCQLGGPSFRESSPSASRWTHYWLQGHVVANHPRLPCDTLNDDSARSGPCLLLSLSVQACSAGLLDRLRLQ